MGKHFFAHELLHGWYCPRQASDADFAEPLTQYLTQRFLVEKGFVSRLSCDDDVRGRKATAEAGREIDRLFLNTFGEAGKPRGD